MNILLCNDDGIFSEGLKSLAEVLIKLNHSVTIFAPDGNRSGSSHSTTFFKEIVVKKTDLNFGCESFSMGGSPADCVSFGIKTNPNKFDVVVAGINKGENVGRENFYSGTVGCCMEALVHKVPAICFSNQNYINPDYKGSMDFVYHYFDRIVKYVSVDYLLNVNMPDVPFNQMKGVKITQMGDNYYNEDYHLVDGKIDTYILDGYPVSDKDTDTDSYNLSKGYVTITPVRLPSTYLEAISKLKEIEDL